MLPPGAGRRGPAGRAVHLRLGGQPWGTVPGPPGPAMARPQRTPARSPDSIVEVKSKVRAPPASALATALDAPILFLSLTSSLVSITSFCPPSSASCSAFLSASPHRILLPTMDLQSLSVAWVCRKGPWTVSLVLELRFKLKGCSCCSSPFSHLTASDLW